jgi:uncharacterized membrane protein (UPF0136 family)
MRRLETVYLLLAIASGLVLVVAVVLVFTDEKTWIPAVLPTVIGVVALRARHKSRQARQKNDEPGKAQVSADRTPE